MNGVIWAIAIMLAALVVCMCESLIVELAKASWRRKV